MIYIKDKFFFFTLRLGDDLIKHEKFSIFFYLLNFKNFNRANFENQKNFKI